jgi:Terpene synthase family 2, C-terminal metal binding
VTRVDTSNHMLTTLLSFYCPLTAEVSPHAQRMCEHTLVWARRFDLGEGDDRRTTMLAATGATAMTHMFPHATGGLAQALSDYSAWAWMPNDLGESGQPIGDIFVRLGRWERMRSPDSWPDATDPHDSALRDVFLRLRCLMSAVQWQRFTAPQEAWIYQVGWEASLAERNAELSVNDYLAMRLGSGAAYASVGFVEAVEGIELGERQWARPIVRAAAEAAACCGVLDNDRYSLLRERDLAIKKYNLFDALRGEHTDYSADQAITEAIAIRAAS